MLLLIIGLVLFLGVHFARVFFPQRRESFIRDRGELAYKIFYSVLSIIGFGLLIVGYSQTRVTPQHIWFPPAGMAHAASLLTLVAFVLLFAAYVPGNRIKSAVGHPMVLGVKIWAFAHLIANGRLGDMVLFGAFLIWAIVLYARSRKIDRAQGVVRVSANSIARDAITVLVGIGAWLVFAMWAHVRLIGVSPFGG
ncbi:MAG: NnrU family protein [Granulosicoccus sp.]